MGALGRVSRKATSTTAARAASVSRTAVSCRSWERICLSRLRSSSSMACAGTRGAMSGADYSTGLYRFLRLADPYLVGVDLLQSRVVLEPRLRSAPGEGRGSEEENRAGRHGKEHYDREPRQAPVV